MNLPQAYNFFDLATPSWDYGPIWEEICLGIFGQCGIIKTGSILNPLDKVAYEGTLYIVPAGELFGISIIDYWDYSFVRLIDREKWFEINGEAHRMKKYSIPTSFIKSPAIVT